MHGDEVRDLHSSPKIIRVVKSRGMRLAGHVARIAGGELYAVFWWGNLREREEWIMWLSIRTVAGSCDRVMKLRISYNAVNFLTISFSRRIVDYVFSYSVKGEKLLGFSRRILLSIEFVCFFCFVLFVCLVGWVFQYPLLAVTKPSFKLRPYIHLKLYNMDGLAVQGAMVLIRTSWITVRIP